MKGSHNEGLLADVAWIILIMWYQILGVPLHCQFLIKKKFKVPKGFRFWDFVPSDTEKINFVIYYNFCSIIQ